MKSLPLNALIVDFDRDSLSSFASLVSGTFTRVYEAATPDEAIKHFKTNKPQVVFFNLVVRQRRHQFELLSKFLEDPEQKSSFFGYSDSIESEFLAHCLENGIQDLFGRPYDADIISTKIHRFYQTDKTVDKSLNNTPLKPALPIQVHLKFKISSVDENGFTFKGSQYISKGTSIPLNFPLIEEIFQTTSMDFIVTKTWVSEDLGDFFFFAEPKDGKEHLSSSLRKFILGKI